MADREIRYCTTEDGVRIAYCVEGQGPPLVWVPTFLDSFASEYLWPAREEFMSSLGIGRSLVRFDTRGLGLSQREVEGDLSYRTLARDLDAVLSAARLESVTLMTAGPGSLLAIWYAVSRPQTVRNLILVTPSVSIVEAHVAGSVLESLADLARTNWSMACHALADSLVDRPQRDAALSLADWWMESVTGEIFTREVFDNLDADLSGELASVKAPTLLIYRAESGKHAVDLARRIALAIPNCIFAPVAGRHLLVELDETGEVLRLIDKFVPPAVHALISKSRATFRTVLFTDLVGHTEMMSRLGDERGRVVLREHERITREVLKANGGAEVKTMGDGFMASFGSVTKAVECAIALQRAFADHEGEPLSVRLGLNAGEPIEEDGDLFGATVILASRIAAKADGGEILVADTVRGLCSGKGFLFADRGEFVAKGFEEPVRVYEVSWRE
jgi:class 3 adenylate cyclase